MARLAKMVKDKKQCKLIASEQRQQSRLKLKKILSAPLIDEDDEGNGGASGATALEKLRASFALQRRKRDESKSRRVTRCSQCGRIHSVYQRFGLCSHCIKKYFDLGWLPGLTKSSW